MTATKPDVSIIIVTYNSADFISECLDSVFNADLKIKQEVIVVDNQSKDRTAELIARKYPQVKLITPEDNLGFAKGVNLGAQHSEGEFVLLLNPDTVVKPDCVQSVVEFAREQPSIRHVWRTHFKARRHP